MKLSTKSFLSIYICVLKFLKILMTSPSNLLTIIQRKHIVGIFLSGAFQIISRTQFQLIVNTS